MRPASTVLIMQLSNSRILRFLRRMLHQNLNFFKIISYHGENVCGILYENQTQKLFTVKKSDLCILQKNPHML